MPYRSRDIYRGRRKFRTPLMILLFLLAFALVFVIVAFYGLQQFLVYDENGVSLQFGSRDETETVEAAVPTVNPTPDVSGMQVNIVFTAPSFDDISLPVGEELSALRARELTLAEVMDSTKLAAGVSAAVEAGCSAVVLEMKTAAGQLAWASATTLAASYGTSGLTDFTETLAGLHEQGMYVAAKVAVCADDLMAVRNWPIALRDASGQPYQDANGHYWLDPYNHSVREYIIPLLQELAAMGFDEIILTDLAHPVAAEGTEFQYSTTLRTDPDPRAAVCQLARKLAEAMQSSAVKLSVQIDSGALNADTGAQNGQDLAVFWKLFDRVVCSTSSDSVESDLSAALGFGGTRERFVPYTTWSLLDGWDSGIYIVPAT